MSDQKTFTKQSKLPSLEEMDRRADQLQKEGDHKNAMIWMGHAYIKRKDYRKAIQCFEKTQSWETLADIYLTLGQEKKYHHYFGKYLLSEGLVKEAAESFWEAGSYAQAAQLFENLFDFKRAIQAYVKAGNVNEAGQLLIRIGQPDKAARLFEKAGLYPQAIQYYQKTERWDDLIRIYDRTKKYLKAIKACLQIHDFNAALHFVDKIDKSSEKYLQAYVYIMLFLQENNKEDLIPSMFYDIMYDRRVKLNENQLLMLAELLEKTKYNHEALQAYRRIVNLGNSLPHVLVKISNLERKLQFIKQKEELRSYTNRFLLYRFLGQGAMSKVYKSKDTQTEQWVALKTFSRDQEDEDHVQAFFQEARTTANLHHPNIIQIFDYGIENEHLFISMEYLQGKTLKYVLDQTGPIPLHDFLNIAAQLCKALMYAHDMHVVHRDIKPSNIMLLKDKTVKLMDFGIAKLSHMANSISIARGTPRYASPEQILGIQTTKQSDLYSLAVVFYEMLSGKPPFEGENALHDQVNKTPEPLDQVVDRVPYVLVNIIMACLAKKPDRRPAGIHKVLEVIETIRHTLYEETTKERIIH
ncbi:MAG: protein kinase [Bdellovibrionales bacterium]|nr:protein kinase [Bdellovibrionales bacterium]